VGSANKKTLLADTRVGGDCHRLTVRLGARWTWIAESASVNTTSAPMLLRGVWSRLTVRRNTPFTGRSERGGR